MVHEGSDESAKITDDNRLDKCMNAVTDVTSESKGWLNGYALRLFGVVKQFPFTVDVKPNSIATPVLATGILLPISNLKKAMNLDAGPIIVVNALPKAAAIMPKKVARKEIPGKIAILPLKSKAVARRQRIRRTKKEIEKERKSTEESKLVTLQKSEAVEPAIDSDGNKCDSSQTDPIRATDGTINDSSKTQDIQSDNNRLETTEPTLPQPELSNDILASLQIPQNDSNNESMSPTAAFLMSFPVVSSGVRVGDDEQETHDAQSLQQSNSASKPATESNILENISSLLTTKDYERFVEDAVKNDAPNCEANSKPMKDGHDEICLDKRGTAMSFDFQLKPIIGSCAEVKTDSCLRTSVTCSSTYLPEIGNLSYKSSPLKKHRKPTTEENFTNVSTMLTADTLLSTTQNRMLPVSTDDYIRNHAAMDFINPAATVLHNLEPPTKIRRLNDAMEHVKRTEAATFENLFLRNTPASNTMSYSSMYSYDKVATTVSKSDSKNVTTESASFTSYIPTSSHGVMDVSALKSRKVAENAKEIFNYQQPFTVHASSTTGTTASIKQLNSLYSYPANTTTCSSTSISQISSNIDGPSHHSNTAKSTASIDKTFFKPNHSTTSATDGFYTSLTSIGTTHSSLPQYPSSIMRPNMYTSALSLSSSSNQKALDYAPQTSFTFSLTTPLNTVSNAKSTALSSCQQTQNYLPPPPHSTSSYQDYNPFAFENISSITAAPITPYNACREAAQFSFSLTSTTNKVTPKNPMQSSFSIDQNFLAETRTKPVTPVKSNTPAEKKMSYKHCSKDDVATHPDGIKNKESTQKVEKSSTKQHVNWMTDMEKNEYPASIPPLDYTQSASLPNHYLPQPTTQLPNSQKNSDIYFAHQIVEENFQWSPNKMIDTPNINSTTLPNLHGDLALNNSLTPKPQVSSLDKSKTSRPMLSTHMHQSPQNAVPNPTNSYFSVSQLVEHPKSVGQLKPYEDAALQSKTSKSTSNQSRFKHKDSKKIVKPPANVSNFTPNIFVESFAYNEPQKQNHSNNYSAEALISIHPPKKETKSLPNYANQSDYCNQLDTYNNMDYLNESNYNYYNNSYFTSSITDNETYFCSGTYPDQQFPINKSSRTSATSTKQLSAIGDTTYGSHTSQNNLYSFPHPSGKLCQQSSQYKNSTPQLPASYNQSRSYSNASKKQFKQDLIPSYEPNSSTNYFTPSLNINTPIIPHPPLITTPNIPSNEDFNYTSHINYPTSLAKTSSYPAAQQMAETNGMLHGSVVGGGGGGGGVGAGNLVTNFNLSTICPEINDKTRQQNW